MSHRAILRALLAAFIEVRVNNSGRLGMTLSDLGGASIILSTR